jgi:hypothetical protein
MQRACRASSTNERGARFASRPVVSSLEACMSTTKQARLDPSAQIPVTHMPWFMQMLMIFAVVALAGIVYGFWQISQAESVPPAATDTQSQPAP